MEAGGSAAGSGRRVAQQVQRHHQVLADGFHVGLTQAQRDVHRLGEFRFLLAAGLGRFRQAIASTADGEAVFVQQLADGDCGVFQVIGQADFVGDVLLSHLLDLSVSQLSYLLPLHYQSDFRPDLGNLRTPPLLFGRRPPQSNCLPCTVPDPDYGSGLEPQRHQGGISRTAPQKLASLLLSLPPILHK